MLIPKVKFSVIRLKYSFSVIGPHLDLKRIKEGRSHAWVVFKYYPELERKLKGVKDETARKEIAWDFFAETFYKDKAQFKQSATTFQKSWDKVNKPLMQALAEIIEIDWPKKYGSISAKVSLAPFGPYNLEKRMYEVYYRTSIEGMKVTGFHELLHFLYFEKWNEVFPKTRTLGRKSSKMFLVWRLSEMVPRIILHDARIQRIFRYDFPSYPVYENAIIDGKPLLSYLQRYYDERKDFTDFLEKSWKFVMAHEKVINSLVG